MTADEEREHLEALLHHPGWELVQAYARTEFVDKILSATESAANELDEAALSRLRQLIAGKRAAALVLGYPKERLRQLTDARELTARGVSLSRGGA